MMPWARPLQPPQSQIPQSVLGAVMSQKVLIGTPTRGREVNDNHRRCVDELRVRLPEQVLPLSTVQPVRDGEQDKLLRIVLDSDETTGRTGVLASPRHLPLTRDRFFRLFLERSAADWILWWDDDVWCRNPHIILANMLATALLTDAHVLGAMYPRKARDEAKIAQAVRDGKPNPLQHGFTVEDMRIWFHHDPENDPPPPHEWMLPVYGVGFGFCLVSRHAGLALTERYRSQLQYTDRMLGGKTVGLHHQILDGFDNYGEDYSFCQRARDGAFGVYAFMGPGSPVIHDGCDSFEAHPDCLKYRREGQ